MPYLTYIRGSLVNAAQWKFLKRGYGMIPNDITVPGTSNSSNIGDFRR